MNKHTLGLNLDSHESYISTWDSVALFFLKFISRPVLINIDLCILLVFFLSGYNIICDYIKELGDRSGYPDSLKNRNDL